MDSAQIKKIEEYVVFLARQAEDQEGKDDSQAIQNYVKAADILLALASKAQDQTTWERYTKQAEGYQQRAKKRVPSVQTETHQGSAPRSQSSPPPPVSRGRSHDVQGEKSDISETKPGRLGRIIGALHSGNTTRAEEGREPTPALQVPMTTQGYSIPSAVELEKRRMSQTLAQQTGPLAQQTVTADRPIEKETPANETLVCFLSYRSTKLQAQACLLLLL